ncbi:MAG TPA: DUF423 domain-containing protein [Candidatus Polarisedimenticolaceae bacterium]|nr:DUF423 domain-containing protein [Candidatus Polarisedimenticolaceae bacterium]
MASRWFAIGAGLAAAGVALGAFGAHALKGRLSSEALAIWETAARYHLIHALALLATGWAAERWPGGWTTAAGWAFVTGIVIFGGSLYGLALTGARALGAITPFGGLCLIAGWICLAIGAARGR